MLEALEKTEELQNSRWVGTTKEPSILDPYEVSPQPPPLVFAESSSSVTDMPPLAFRTGRWNAEEKLLFLYGLKRYGKGRWKRISVFLPHRSLVQIKSHAQKVLKRQEAGDDIFRILQDTSPALIDSLVVQAARERDAVRAASVSVSNTANPSKNLIDASKKAVNNSGDNSNDYNTKKSIGKKGTAESGPESVIAAAALCQLSSVGTQQQWDQLDPLDVTMMVNQEANV